ncbi:hypothetical protein [Lederbergia citrea]|uniref:Uncharacterized protein n=1 Tax=Lederbergia citrea TaxID=2833581 RepID=A0A942UR61_9BACI|nr:hypothetical protein [Lederbergia citrea]MBS4205904.1 hypothetical protein [Lederbergia citrea]MBS4224647.1 hypothetical protein [Lederbergia citrea]
MDKMTRRIRCNPDGTVVFKRWDNTLVIKGKSETIHEPENGYMEQDGMRIDYYSDYAGELQNDQGMTDSTDAIDKGLETESYLSTFDDHLIHGWETEIEY